MKIKTSLPKRIWIRFVRGDYVKFFLGMAAVALMWAWSAQFAQSSYTLQEVRDYSVQYLNEVK